jgi:hypothetical protein
MNYIYEEYKSKHCNLCAAALSYMHRDYFYPDSSP